MVIHVSEQIIVTSMILQITLLVHFDGMGMVSCNRHVCRLTLNLNDMVAFPQWAAPSPELRYSVKHVDLIEPQEKCHDQLRFRGQCCLMSITDTFELTHEHSCRYQAIRVNLMSLWMTLHRSSVPEMYVYYFNALIQRLQAIETARDLVHLEQSYPAPCSQPQRCILDCPSPPVQETRSCQWTAKDAYNH